ncbi:autophagy protein 5 [Tilletia horrida]|uniref:Autophagy protein 5 n=1 Tax=Tilletia horrida TaxID=155126 RepID=A0AAN6JZV3_9BASI|nr:autophagy protein 5 [Tilletia horrida]KAK0569018.1 autophagy protein 5 [Tilletia horrida]
MSGFTASSVSSGAGAQPAAAAASSSSTSSAGGPASSSSLPTSALASRKLTFNASLPILIELVDAPASETTPIAQYYTNIPRISYLPLLIPHLRKYFLDTVLDEAQLLTLSSPTNKDETSLWFEFGGTPLRWHWPIGLLYDFHTANPAETSVHPRPASSLASSPGRAQLDSYFTAPTSLSPPPSHINNNNNSQQQRAYHSASGGGGASPSSLPWRIRLHLKSPPTDKLNMASTIEACRTNFMSMVKEADFVRYGTTRRVINLRRTEQDALWEGVVEHDFEKYWSVASKLLPPLNLSSSSAPSHQSSIDPLLDNNHSGFHALSISPSRTPSLVPSIASSSTTNVSSTTGGRPPQPPGGLITTEGGTVKGSTSPYASPTISGGGPASQSTFSVASDATGLSLGGGGGGSGVGDTTVTPAVGSSSSSTGGGAAVHHGGFRHIPMRIHLPDGAPVVQEPVPPYFEDGRPRTLFHQLSALFPLLFPPAPSFASHTAPPAPLAFCVVQGIRVPLEAEIAWLGAVLGGADGWLSVVVQLNPES